MNYDVVIVGAGPAGIFTALELIKLGSKKKILIIEKYISNEEKREEIINFIENLKNNDNIEKSVEFIKECDIIINILNNLERLKIHQKNLLKDDNEESNQNEIFI